MGCGHIDGAMIYGVWVHRWCYDIWGVGTDGAVIYGVWDIDGTVIYWVWVHLW